MAIFEQSRQAEPAPIPEALADRLDKEAKEREGSPEHDAARIRKIIRSIGGEA